MSLTKTEYGKAYEFACLDSLRRQLTEKNVGPILVTESDALRTAQTAFEKAQEEGVSNNLMLAADAAMQVILYLEPQLEHGNGVLSLAIQTDAQGIAGDVRDVVFSRGRWELGISCKHNHEAVKHSRLSATIDFGDKWFGIPCSETYFNTVVPIFNELREMCDSARANNVPVPLWSDIPDKVERYYIPVLNAFLAELRRLAQANPDIPKRLIEYMLGRHDFYKVITNDSGKTTKIEAINIAGKLNKTANGHKSRVKIPKVKLPTRFYHMDMIPDSTNKIVVVCDEGWTLTMRIHNAKEEVEPSLKFDVQLLSVPNSIHSQVALWEEEP